MVGMVAIDILSLLEMLSGNVWAGIWLWVSPSAFSTAFIGTGILVRRRGLSYMDAFLVSLTTMVSMIWMYEIFYHFGFYADWEFANQARNLVVANYNQPVVTDVLLASVGLVGWKYMHAGRVFVLSFVAFLTALAVWVAIGYPQVATPGILYPFGSVLVRVSNPDSWAYPLNILTKYLLAFTYVSLYIGKPDASRAWTSAGTNSRAVVPRRRTMNLPFSGTKSAGLTGRMTMRGSAVPEPRR
jgi:hypothetical protein